MKRLQPVWYEYVVCIVIGEAAIVISESADVIGFTNNVNGGA